MLIKRSVEVFNFDYKGKFYWEIIPPAQSTDFLLKAYSLPVDRLCTLQLFGPLYLVQGMDY